MSDLTDNEFYPSTQRICVYALEQRWESGPAIDLQKKNYHFRWSSFWSWRVCKQAKLSHLRHRKPARIHWKADTPKTSHFLVRILIQRHNWANYLWKWARRGRYCQWRSLSDHIERIFVHKNWRGRYWQHLVSQKGATCHIAESILDVLRTA